MTGRSGGMKVARIALLAIPAATPLAMTNLTGLGFSAPFTSDVFSVPKLAIFAALLAIAFIGWGSALASGETDVVIPRGWPYLIAFIALSAISAVFAVHRWTAFFGSAEYDQGLLFTLLVALAWFLVPQILRRADDVRAALISVIAGGVVVALYGLAQAVGFDRAQWPGVPPLHLQRGISTLGNPDMLGGYLVFPLIAAVALALTEAKAKLRVTYWLAASLFAGALVWSETRAAWIGAALGLGFFAVLAWRARVPLTRVDRGFLLAAPALALVVGVANNVATRGEFARRAIGAFSGGSDALGGRLIIWRDTLHAIALRPLLGVGPDSFALAWWPVRSVADVRYSGFASLAQDAHSLPLTLAATVGIPAAIAFFALACASLFRATSAVVRSNSRSASMVLVAGVSAMIVGYLGFLLLGVNTIAPGVLLWMCLGLLTSGGGQRAVGKVTRTVIIGAGTAFVLAAVVVVTMAYSADAFMVRSQLATSPLTALSDAERAVKLAPWRTQYRAQVAALEAQVALSVVQETADSASLDSARNAYRWLIDFSPRTYSSYADYAGFLNKAALAVGPSVLPDAEKTARRAVALCPSGLGGRMELALALVNEGKAKQAADVLARWWDADPLQSSPGVLYAQCLIDAGEREAARGVVASLAKRFGPQAEGVPQLQAALSETD